MPCNSKNIEIDPIQIAKRCVQVMSAKDRMASRPAGSDSCTQNPRVALEQFRAFHCVTCFVGSFSSSTR